MSQEPKNYHPISRAIHWISALSIIGMFGVGWWMVDLSYYSEWYKTAPFWHKSIGVLLGMLTLFRLIWKRVVKSPEIHGTRIEVVAAKAAHHMMYLLLFVIFISGYLISTADGRGIEVFNWFTVPALGELFDNQSDLSGLVHYYAAVTVMILALVHALAAIKHHVIDKDETLRKMLGVSK